MNNTEIVPLLNTLIGTCVAGQENFRRGAESLLNSEFRRLFNIFWQQRSQFVSELQAEVERLGGDPGAVAAGASEGSRRTNVISMVPRDEGSVIAECLTEEQSAVDQYEEVLSTDLPLDVQYVIKRQYMDIKDACDRIRILQRAA